MYSYMYMYLFAKLYQTAQISIKDGCCYCKLKKILEMDFKLLKQTKSD
jgi:hypothetical protein